MHTSLKTDKKEAYRPHPEKREINSTVAAIGMWRTSQFQSGVHEHQMASECWGVNIQEYVIRWWRTALWLLSPVSMCTATYLLCVKGLPGTSAVSSFFQSSYQLLYFLYFPSIPNLRIKVHSPEESKTAEEGRKMNGEGLMEQKQGVNLGNRTGQAHGRGTPGSSRGSRDSGVALRPVVRWEG